VIDVVLRKKKNSQILRRPQDDSPCEGPVTLKPTPIFVILRPPKDLAVLPFEERCANIG
jgi:hypothetical protein